MKRAMNPASVTSAARERFDRWAPRYERDRRSRLNARPQDAALAALALEPRDRLLDVGCGSGGGVRAAAASVDRAVGVDISPAMIERAEELAAGLAGVEFVVGESEELPFPDETFTAVMCSSSFHHYPDPTRALAEMARVLAPGGRVVLAEPSGDMLLARIADPILRHFDASHVRLYRSSELGELVAAAGFTDVNVRSLGSRGYVIASGRLPRRA